MTTTRRLACLLAGMFAGASSPGCGGEAGTLPEPAELSTQAAALSEPDGGGLREAYATFKKVFTDNGFDRSFRVSVGHQFGLSTEKLSLAGQPMRGNAIFNFDSRRVTATLVNVPSTTKADLWLVKNVAGSGRTIRPESGDTLLKVGTFSATGEPRSLDVLLGSNVNFDLDMVVVTRGGQSPINSRLLVGARTVFEKKFFRERAGKQLDAVSGTVANNVETTDKMVGRGAHLFFNELFAGNGRTCGTCHRATNNLTIDPVFIATLPPNDALFVAETNPAALGALENPALMRQQGLILENVDGFEDPTRKFVMRGVPHTLGMVVTQDILAANVSFTPVPDQALGWGGDGPGRGTIADFTFGAIVQHFTKTLSRRPGTDFRLPTQEEVDALEAFQLFTGRQKTTDVREVAFREPRAQTGKTLFFSSVGQCSFCHFDMSGLTNNLNFNTGVALLTPPTPERPDDDGFLANRSFNVPPLLEAADTAPLFHNNTASSVETAVAFYVSPQFQSSPDGRFFPVQLGTQQQSEVADFLRVVNAAENIRQVRKRVDFVRTNRTSGNTSLLDQAIADTRDAIEVLSAKSLNLGAQNMLRDVEQTLLIARANADAARPPFMEHALAFLTAAKSDLVSADPASQL